MTCRSFTSTLLVCAGLALSIAGAGCRSAEPPPAAPAASPGAFQFTPEQPPKTVEGFRVATFNTEFLFDGLDNEGQATFAWKGDPAAARAHMKRVADVIRTLDADVIMLEEVENIGVLEELAGGMLAGMGYTPYLIDGTDTFTGQDVGLLARVPIDTVGRTDDRAPVAGSDDDYGVSKNLFARLSLRGIPTTLIGVHFLSQPTNESRKPRREAQAEVIRRLVEREENAGRAVMVLGDFNDFDPAVPDQMSSTPISNVLSLIRSAGPGTEDDLHNALERVSQNERFTNFWDRDEDGEIEANELSAIDHILLSPLLFERVKDVDVVQAHDPRLAPDHFPIVVTLAAP